MGIKKVRRRRFLLKPDKERHKKFFRKEIFSPGEPRRLARAPSPDGDKSRRAGHPPEIAVVGDA